MMKIFVLERNYAWETTEILGVFSSYEKAAAATKQPIRTGPYEFGEDFLFITEWDLDNEDQAK
jgi:hypothetical protein